VEIIDTSTLPHRVLVREVIPGDPPSTLVLRSDSSDPLFSDLDGQSLVLRGVWNNTILKSTTLDTTVVIDLSPPIPRIEYGPIPNTASRWYQADNAIYVTTSATDAVR
jgi:hypothetical protein